MIDVGLAEVFGACRAVAARLSRVTALLRAYVSLNTSRLLQLSEEGDLRERAQAWAAVFFLNLLILFSTQWLIFGSGWSFFEALRLVLLAFLGSLFLASPLLIVSNLLRGRSSWFFVGNLVAIGALMGTLTVFAGGLIALSVEPARTDLLLVRKGLGQSTVAYEQICGPTENLAEELVLGRASLKRLEENLADREAMRRLDRAPPGYELLPGWAFAERVKLTRRAATNLEAELASLARLLELRERRSSAPARFAARYPSVVAAGWVTVAGAGLIALMGAIHSWKATVWPAVGWRGKANAVVGLFSAGAATGLSLLAFSELSAPVSAKAKMAAAQEAIKKMDPATAGGFAEAGEAMRAMHLELEAYAQSRFDQMRIVCPRLNNHDAWKAD